MAKKITSSHQLATQLETAIQNLERFTLHHEKMDKEPLALSEEIKTELLLSINFLKKHSFIIPKLQDSENEAQQKLASLAFRVIPRYNQIVTQLKPKAAPSGWKDKVSQFFNKKRDPSFHEELRLKGHTIELPAHATKRYESAIGEASHSFQLKKVTTQLGSSSPSGASLKKISAALATHMPHSEQAPVPLSKQEIDLFCMKAISISQNSPVPIPIRDALNSLKKRPSTIKTVIVKTEPTEDSTSQSIISLYKTIMPFPGEIVKVKGSFRRNANSNVSSVPLPESFTLSTESKQTGHPHPLQHNGFALPHQLIPAAPDNLDELPIFNPVYQQKKQIAQDLLPDGRRIGQARKLLKLKKDAFDEQIGSYLNLNKTLTKSIVQAAPQELVHPEADQIVENFYSHLEQLSQVEPHHSAYENLSHAHQMMMDYFIVAPSDKLQDEWLELAKYEGEESLEKCESLYTDALDKSFEQLQEMLKNASSESEKVTFAFIIMMGRIFSISAKKIILQQLSEKLHFAPPQMSVEDISFEQMIQAAVYKQLIEFINELDHQLEEDNAVNIQWMHQHLKKQLQSDIALFKAKSFDDLQKHDPAAISSELEVYYNTHYYQRPRK